MANYSFLKEAKVYIVYGTTKKQLDISSISFSQTFTEQTRSVRTLHNPTNVFEGSVINTANPANFEMTVHLLIQPDLRIVFDRLTDVQSFDLYIVAEDTYRLRNCFITNGQINIERLRPLSLSISGEAAQLYSGATLPSGMVLRTSASPRTYNLCSDLSILLGGTNISDQVVSVSMELQNEIEWTPYKTVNNALVTGGTMYPVGAALKGKTLAGNITRYLNSDTKSDASVWGTGQSLRIKAGTILNSALRGIDLDTTNCSFTNRIKTGRVFTQNIDWRMVQNEASLTGVLSYITQS